MTKELLSGWLERFRLISLTAQMHKIAKVDSRVVSIAVRCALAFTSLILLFFAARNISRITAVANSDAVDVKAELRNNLTIKLPAPTMCLQIDIRNIDSPVDSDSPAKVREYLNMFDRNIEDVIMSVPDKIAAGVPTTFDLSSLRPLIALTSAMLADITRVENNVHMHLLKEVKNPEGYKGKALWGGGDASQGHQESMELIYNFYADRKIDLTEVIKAMGSLLCSLAEVKVNTHAWHTKTFSPINVASSPCYKSNITWLGTQPLSLTDEEFVCFRVVSRFAFTFMYGTANTRVSLSPQNLYEGFDLNKTSKLAESGFVDFNGFQVVDSFHMGWLSFPYLKGTNVDISIVGDHRAINTASNPCGNTTGVTCRLKCRAANFQDVCGCFPVSAFHIATKPPKMPFCSDASDRQNYAADKYTILKRTDEPCLSDVSGKNFYPTKCASLCQLRKCNQLVLEMRKTVAELDNIERLLNRTFIQFESYRHSHYLMKEVYQSDDDEFTTEMSQSVSILLLLALTFYYLTKSAYQMIFGGQSGEIRPVIFHNDTSEMHEGTSTSKP